MVQEELKNTVREGLRLWTAALLGVLVFTFCYTALALLGLPEADSTAWAFGLMAITVVDRLGWSSALRGWVSGVLRRRPTPVPGAEGTTQTETISKAEGSIISAGGNISIGGNFVGRDKIEQR